MPRFTTCVWPPHHQQAIVIYSLKNHSKIRRPKWNNCLAYFIFLTLFFCILVTLVACFSLNLCQFWISVRLILPCLVKIVTKHDYVIFLYFHNFVDRNEKWNEKLKYHRYSKLAGLKQLWKWIQVPNSKASEIFLKILQNP